MQLGEKERERKRVPRKIPRCLPRTIRIYRIILTTLRYNRCVWIVHSPAASSLTVKGQLKPDNTAHMWSTLNNAPVTDDCTWGRHSRVSTVVGHISLTAQMNKQMASRRLFKYTLGKHLNNRQYLLRINLYLPFCNIYVCSPLQSTATCGFIEANLF